MQISHFRVENYSSNKTCVELVGGVNWENSVEISGFFIIYVEIVGISSQVNY